MTTVTNSPTWIEDLRSVLTGRLVTPADPDYDAIRNDFDGNHDPRKFDAYYGVVGVDLDTVYLNAGYGITRLFATNQDKLDAVNAKQDPIKTQRGISAGMNYRFSKNLVAALEYFNADHTWYLGETQKVNIVNTGLTMVW